MLPPACLTLESQLKTLDGITFYDQPGTLYCRARQIANAFHLILDKSSGKWRLDNRPIPTESTRKLVDGTLLVSVTSLKHNGMSVRWDPKESRAVVKVQNEPGKALYIRRGAQRVVLNKRAMQLVAWQGRSVVFRSTVGIGKIAHQTPNGIFKAQAYRTPLHRSTLYNESPMPWAIHIVGDIFIHGAKVAEGRSSHGCIRLPMTGPNKAKWFYSWIEKGTPVSISGAWPKNA
ncbi:MAG TPA: L,D-transpeptidase [Fimbriimonadaceae bacterium]|nr:L,D-transpeptidase [Fimbriimonadaceae bacterium]